MKEEKLFEMMTGIDEKYVAEARTKTTKKKQPVWVKWSAMAACLCVIIASVIAIPNMKHSNTSGTLMGKLSECNIEAQAISNPNRIASREMPQITKEDILESIHNNLTIQGTISEIESVRVKDADTVWYITTAEINVDEVLSGTAETDAVHIVCGAVYTGQIDDEWIFRAPGLEGCQKGTNGVFVLRELTGEAWSICGKDVYPKSLGDYYIVYHLERSETVLKFVEQGIDLTIDEIK